MWSSNSKNINSINSKFIPIDKNNENNINEIRPLYQTPIKQSINFKGNNDTPIQFDFRFYFNNLYSSSGHIPRKSIDPSISNSFYHYNKESNILLFKSSLEKSGFKLTPSSEIKNNNFLGNGICNLNNIYGDELNPNEMSKKNLNELFNNAKNQTSLYDEQKHKFIKNFNNYNNYNILNINNFSNNNHQNNSNYINKPKPNEAIKNKNYNLQISRQFIFSSPLCNSKPKKIFECSGSTVATLSSNKNINKNRRFRKNNEQITLLKKFYNEHKHWSKNQIKEISQKIGLKENKVYKWLWDQRNKEIKATKFVVKKDGNKNNENNNNNKSDDEDNDNSDE